jgi:hypothetical protein
MPFPDARANAALDALLSGATKIRIYTASYAAQLCEVPITIGSAAVSAGVSTITVSGLPISDTWDATGTAASFRVLNVSNGTVYEGTGSFAVGVTGGGAFLQLSSVATVSGAPLNITSVSFTFATKAAGEP